MPVSVDGTVGVTSPAFVGTTGTFSGALQGTTGTFSGALQASGVSTNLYPLVPGTAVAITGATYDFTNIPSWARRITLMFNNVRKSSTSAPLIQLIISTGVVNTGYLGVGNATAAATTVTSYTTGFGIRALAATDTVNGTLILSNLDGNIWVASGVTANTITANSYQTSGSVTLSGVLTGVRITTTGADVYNQGNVNIMYE